MTVKQATTILSIFFLTIVTACSDSSDSQPAATPLPDLYTLSSNRSGLSTATVAESRLYVIKSDVLHFFLNQTLDTPFEIFRVDINAFDQE